MEIAPHGCPECHGDLVTNYKHGRLFKCLACKKVFSPGNKKVRPAILRARAMLYGGKK